MSTTPNMGLLLPDPTITPGPTYASEIDDAFDLVDSHDHTLGKGVPIPANAININNDLPFNGYNLTTIRAARFNSQSAVLSTPQDINQLYVVNGNLVYNNQLGQPVQITLGAALDATSIGGIGGDFATSTASVFYTSADKTFTFWSNTNTPASIDAGNIIIRNDTLNSFGITLAPDPSIAADYQLTLPATLPSATSSLQVDPSGVVSYTGGVTPAGAIIMWGGAAAPSGWLLCDGTSYLRTAQAGIFAAIGTAYGTADGTHFNVPDMRGMFPRGVDPVGTNDPDNTTRTANNPGGNTGINVGSQQGWQLESHVHSKAILAGGGTGGIPAWADAAAPSGSANTNATGGNQTNPINVYFNFIIKQ